MKLEKQEWSGNGEERFYVGATKKELKVLGKILQKELDNRCPPTPEFHKKRDYLRTFLQIIDDSVYN